ncbi:hypothetical protein D3C87_928300 [compost metagenome]
MGCIQYGLGVGDVVNGGHGAVLDAELLVDHLHHWRQTVGGAGGCRHYKVLRLVVEVVVDPHHYVEHTLLLDRSSHHDPLHPLRQIGIEQRLGFHLAGSLDHHITTGPVGLTDLFVASAEDTMVTDHHLVPIAAGFMMPAAMDGIEGDEVCQGSGIASRVIDAHKLHIRPVEGGAK